MMESWPPADEPALVAEIVAAMEEARAVPAADLAAARAAYAWRTVDAELALAELIFDSACDAEPAGLTRFAGSPSGPPLARTLAFRGGRVAIDLEVTEAGIVGQVSPATGGRVVARTADGVFDEAELGPIGFFALGTPPPGPVQLCAYTDSYAVATSWVPLT